MYLMRMGLFQRTGARMSGATNLPLGGRFEPGFEGNGHVVWIAETAGASFRRCGRAERRGLVDDAVLRVFTNSECVKGAQW
jgi:hypothetical protein